MRKDRLYKRALALSMAAALMAGNTGIVSAQEASFGESFADPETDTSIRIRTWWPSAEITDEEIAEEVKQTAEAVKAYAEAGLPIILIGETPTTDGTYGADDDAEITGIFDSLKEMENVSVIESEEELPQTLMDAGITPSAQYSEEVKLAAQHRTDENVDLYYFYNYTGSYDYGTNDVPNSDDAEITTTVTMEGTGTPYQLDPWSGEVTILNDYTDNGDGTISIELTVKDGEPALIAITEDSSVFADAVEKTECEYGEAVSLDDNTWMLDVISYEPGELAQDREADDYDPTDIAKVAKDTITLDALSSWDSLEGLENVSGQGTYTTTFTLEDGVAGAVLDLGDCNDNILEVSINGNVISSMNQITHEVDLGEYAVSGENTLVIRTGTTLAAAVRAAGGNVMETDSSTVYPTVYGLLGGVTVTPYF